MRQASRAVLAVAAAGAALVMIAAWPAIVRAFNPQPDPPGKPFGMVGLARMQTARLNVVNLGSGDPPGEADPPGCRVTLGFVDGTGRSFTDRMGMEIVSEASLMPGEATHLDLRAGDALRDRGTRRVQIRPGIDPGSEVGGAVPHLSPCTGLVATLEIFDSATGATTLLYHPPDRALPAVQVGDPTGLGEPTGVTRGQ
ncbi:MAG: hypothetical protein FJW14_13260 [Acidimicrobiia bacterium]|nr:hypothetical protein [Acidimicrobiia bacterium]